MIDFSLPYSCEWRLRRVDVRTWADSGAASPLLSASVRRDSSGDEPEIDSGTLEVMGDWGPGYHRLTMVAEQAGSIEAWPIATLLCERAGSENGRVTLTGRSVLHPAATEAARIGEHVRAGEDGAQAVARLLRGSIAAPVSVEGSFSLEDHYDFTPGQSVLSAAWAVLNAAGFCLRVEGDGTVHVCPLPSEESLSLDAAAARSMLSGPSDETGIADAINRFTAYEDGVSATAENRDSGPGSYAERGYWNEEFDDSPVRVNGETLGMYARRRLAELSPVREAHRYSRAFVPGVCPFDMVRSTAATLGVDGLMRVESQDYEASSGLLVSETAIREVQTWTE